MLTLLRSFDFAPRLRRLRMVAGNAMAIAEDARKSVVFIGHGEDENFVSVGTGFFIQHKSAIYIVTARHIVEGLGNDPYAFRFNKSDGGSTTLSPTWTWSPRA